MFWKLIPRNTNRIFAKGWSGSRDLSCGPLSTKPWLLLAGIEATDLADPLKLLVLAENLRPASSAESEVAIRALERAFEPTLISYYILIYPPFRHLPGRPCLDRLAPVK